MELPVSSWADKALLVISGAVGTGGVVGVLRLIFYRRKPQSEIAKIDADTESIRAATKIKLSERIEELHDKLNFLEVALDESHRKAETERETMRERHETQTGFLREQLQYFEQLDLTMRKRSHEMGGELGRLVLQLKELESVLIDNKITPPAFKIRTQDEIFAPYPLPVRSPQLDRPQA